MGSWRARSTRRVCCRACCDLARGLLVGSGLAAAACAGVPKGVVVPTAERLIAAPARDSAGPDPVLLTHLLRGLYFASEGHAAAAIPHLRLAQMYDPNSAFIDERLSDAWSASGDEAHARAVLAEGLRKNPEAAGLNLIAGRLRANEQRFADAKAHFARAFAADTVLSAAAPGYVDALLWLKERPGALAVAALALQRSGETDAPALGMAQAFEDHGELAAALDYYRHARQERPADEHAVAGEVRVLSLLGRDREGADALVPLFERYPDEVTVYLQMARLLRRAKAKEAERYREAALQQSAGDPDQRLRVAASDLFDGRVAAGVAVLRDTLREHPEHLDTRLYLARALIDSRDYSGGLDLLAEPSAPSVAAVHRLRAECYAALGAGPDFVREARAAMQAGVAADEVLPLTQTLAGRFAVETALGLRDELVVGIAVPATELDLSLAVLLDHAGQSAAAVALVDELWQREPDDVDLCLRWADLQARHGSLTAAIDVLTQLLRDNPDDVSRLNALGFLLADSGRDLAQAEVWLRRAYRLAPEQGFVTDSLGWLCFRLGRFAEARRLLEQANHSAPNDAEILLHLGEVYGALGLVDEARRAFAQGLASGPSADVAARLRAQGSGRRA